VVASGKSTGTTKIVGKRCRIAVVALCARSGADEVGGPLGHRGRGGVGVAAGDRRHDRRVDQTGVLPERDA
jgi:hypothetical protein